MWKQLKSSEDALALMQEFGNFHDGCIREMHLWGGYFVDTNLSMTCPDTPDLKCRVVVQRQWLTPATIEMLFIGVSHCSICAEAGYDRIIGSATLEVGNAGVIWSPDSHFDLKSGAFGASSAIVARHMYWRSIENGLGPKLSFGITSDLPEEEEL